METFQISTILLKSGRVIGKINTNPNDKSPKSVVTDDDVSNIYDIYLLHFDPGTGKKTNKTNHKGKKKKKQKKKDPR
eukprot:gnl/Chilomastix_caulleri/6894.p2 GENE.gnl/Chilomastix_caulleri/6894~~gnl/Chilomastix_caulleri/6894.p2  ORF type:complete len:77 (+),score=22.61 gnl/Chilomastix_caulleri/6894:60-290(+)